MTTDAERKYLFQLLHSPRWIPANAGARLVAAGLTQQGLIEPNRKGYSLNADGRDFAESLQSLPELPVQIQPTEPAFEGPDDFSDPVGERPPVKGIVTHVTTKKPWVALTYDSCSPRGAPNLSPNIDTLIQTFRTYGMQGTFNVLGNQAAASHNRLAAIKAAGHDIGNHSNTHTDLTAQADSGYAEYGLCQETVRAATGTTMRFARPPGGKVNDAVVKAARKLGMITLMWGPSPSIYEIDPAAIAEVALDDVTRGSIVLLHTVPQCTEALPLILAGLQARGLRSVKISTLYWLR